MADKRRLTQLRPNRAVVLKNVTCAYCGKSLQDLQPTKEHVIGRRFVPKGLLNSDWNLIVQACQPCNVRKSDLEDDLSAITMQPSSTGKYATTDALLPADAARKAKNSRSRKTGKTVAESVEKLSVHLPLGPSVEMLFTMSAPPQADSHRIFELARLHMVALFYFITYQHESKTGSFWPDEFYPLLASARSDWGNPLHKAFMNAVQDWEPRLIGTTASGYFKAIIRRHPNAATWSWALEWNQSYRIIGFFGETEPAREIMNKFPKLNMHILFQGGGQHLRYREESQLSEDDDLLFHWIEQVSED